MYSLYCLSMTIILNERKKQRLAKFLSHMRQYPGLCSQSLEVGSPVIIQYLLNFNGEDVAA